MELHGKRDFNIFKIIPWIVVGIVGAAALALVFGLIVMALWNWIMPIIFGLPTITYWQAWGLVLLAHILFKGPFGHHQQHNHNRDWNREEWHHKFTERFNRPQRHDKATDEEDSQ